MTCNVKTTLITDLDNTLFDWVNLWHKCFTAMLSKIAEISGVDEKKLKQEIKAVHQRHGTSEYSFLIEELPSLRSKYRDNVLLDRFSEAIEAYRIERKAHLHLYPTVGETLLKIKGTGCTIIGYTESMAFYSNYRVRRLGLNGVIDQIFSPRDHDVPENLTLEQVRRYPSSHYQFKYTRHEHTPPGELKPNKRVLLSIIESMGAAPESCIYVGDSLMKDVAMARDAGVAEAWAKYGLAQHTEAYTLLREVTHWTEKDVEREKHISERHVTPSIVLEQHFSEILDHFCFGHANGS